MSTATRVAARTSDLPPIDPFAPTVDGCYHDARVEVRRAERARTGAAAVDVRTDHFDVCFRDGRVLVEHAVPIEAVDDDLAGLLHRELFGAGWLRGTDLFERVFTGVVRSSAEGALESWELFYRATLARLATARTAPGPDQGHSSIAGYAPVHEHALELLAPGSVLELGCCFGFLSLRAAATGRAVTASDVSPGTVALLSTMAPRLGLPVRTLAADAARVPVPDGSADTVLAVHLLEHLDRPHGAAVVAEALRLAARRVVVAVPLEEEADETFGHVRTVTLEDLRAWGRASGRPFDVHEHHGGWLVLDHPRS